MSTIELKDLKKDQIGLLHRQWMWANYLRIMYESRLRTTPKNVLLNPMKFYTNEVGCYMCLWYSLLFSTLEGLRRWKVEVKDAQSEINEIYEPLKKLRNSVFHPPQKYWDTRYFLLFKTNDVGNKIRKIHSSLDKLFLEVLDKPL